MMKLFEDTHPEIEKIYIKLIGQLPVWKRVRIIDQLYITAFSMVRMSIRRKYPNISAMELKNESAKLFLGDNLSKKIYGT